MTSVADTNAYVDQSGWRSGLAGGTASCIVRYVRYYRTVCVSSQQKLSGGGWHVLCVPGPDYDLTYRRIVVVRAGESALHAVSNYVRE